MSSLDFSQFKKTAQDKKTATLIHPSGHEIKIAIIGLAPDLKKKLEKMPLHQANPEGEVQALDPSSPAEADDLESAAPAIEEGAQKEVAASPPPPAPVAQAPAAPSPQAEAPPQEAPPEQPAQETPEATPEQISAQRTQQDIHFANDLQAGHIKPKTYGDLFAGKDTIGKIGTLFGLIVAGAGAGLTHQPNAVIAMMDKQIQNDLEAQKTDQSNKQNWYKMSIEHTRNQAMNALTNSETAKNWTQNDMDKFLQSKSGVIQGMGSLQAENSMLMTGVQTQQDSINKMPPGPQRDKAQNDLNSLVIPAAFKKIQDNNNKAGSLQHQLMNDAKLGSNQKFNPPPSKGFADPKQYYSAVNSSKLDEAINRGKLDPRLPGAIPPGEVGSIMDEQKALEAHRDTYANAEKAFNMLNSMKNAGQIPAVSATGAAVGSAFGALGALVGKHAGETVQQYYQRQRNIYVDNLIGQLDRGKSEDERRKIAEGMLPAWNDTADSRKSAHNELFQQFAADPREKAPYLSRYGVKTPMPKYSYTPSKISNSLEDAGKMISGIAGGTGSAMAGENEGHVTSPADDVIKGAKGKNEPGVFDSLINALTSKNKKSK